MKNITLTSGENYENFDGIVPLFVGEQRCSSEHTFGPSIREYYLVHIVLSGKGILKDKFGVHEVNKGELFIIRQGEVTVYSADRTNPWHYIWIAFTGKRAFEFIRENSVYTCPVDIMTKLLNFIESEEVSVYGYISLIYDLIYRLFSKKTARGDKVDDIKSYIDYHYMEELNVEKIAKNFNFERSYLFRIFKRKYGVSVKEYIMKTRMEHAMEFLQAGHSVGTVANMVGYIDEFNFSRAFKKYTGGAPSSFKGQRQG